MQRIQYLIGRCFTWDGSFILSAALMSGGKLFSPIDKLGNSSSVS